MYHHASLHRHLNVSFKLHSLLLILLQCFTRCYSYYSYSRFTSEHTVVTWLTRGFWWCPFQFFHRSLFYILFLFTTHVYILSKGIFSIVTSLRPRVLSVPGAPGAIASGQDGVEGCRWWEVLRLFIFLPTGMNVDRGVYVRLIYYVACLNIIWFFWARFDLLF